jgi:hypothetical protein
MNIKNFIIIISVVLSSYFTTTQLLSMQREADSTVLGITKEILALIKNSDYFALVQYIHPVHGVRFSPYAYIDTNADQVLSKWKYEDAFKRKDYEKLNWGSYDGTGDVILLTAKDYFKRFVYDADFLNAEKTSLNQKFSPGNTPSNLEEIYPGCVYTESYFSGFDEKYSGMDWRALRLVYSFYEGKYYLVGIIHDEWTI